MVGDNGGGSNYYQSTTINFTAPTNSIAFNYDPAVFTPPRPLVNTLNLTSGGADTVAGALFQLGTLSFTNGMWFPQAEIGFRLTTHSADASLDGKILDATLRVVSVSTDGSNPYDEADFVFVVGRGELGSMRVFDRFYQPPGDPGFTGEFALMGHVGSLVLDGFESLNPAGFTDPSIEPELVPEPSSALLLLGTGAMVLLRRRRTLRTQERSAKL